MSLTTILFIALAAIFALGFVFFKYFYSNNKRSASLYFLSTLSFISVNKSLVSTQVSSSTITKEVPILEVEVIFFIQSKSLILDSISSVISASISSGLTQGYDTATFIIPNFISGLDSFGIEYKEKIHATMISIIKRKLVLKLLSQK